MANVQAQVTNRFTPKAKPAIHPANDPLENCEEIMTKAKARQRAKAKAAEKAKKRKASAERPDQGIRPGQFDPGSSSIKSPHQNVDARNLGGAKRGAARSR